MSKEATPKTPADTELSEDELNEIAGGAQRFIDLTERPVAPIRPSTPVQNLLGRFDVPTIHPLPNRGGLFSGDDGGGVGIGKVGDGGGVIGTVKF